MEENLLAQIPAEFHSAETGKPFDRCIECDKHLLDGETEYLVEKAMRSYPGYKAQDTIYDFAICMNCAHAMHNKISKESAAKLQGYFAEHVIPKIKKRSMEELISDPSGLTEKCLVKETNREDSTEYQLYAHCKGDKLFMGNPPYMISGEVTEEVMALLSKETKDEFGGFFHKHFAPDPDLFENTPGPKLILI